MWCPRLNDIFMGYTPTSVPLDAKVKTPTSTEEEQQVEDNNSKNCVLKHFAFEVDH